MSKSLTSYLGDANLPAVSDDQLAGALMEQADDGQQGGIGTGDYLSFSGKRGVYSLGRNKEPIDPEQLYIMDPLSVIAGWVCWKGSKPVDRHEWSVLEAKTQGVKEEDLKDHGPYNTKAGDGWAQLRGFSCFACDKLTGQVNFTTTSKSGRNALFDLTTAIAKRSAMGEPTLPVFYFDMEEFTAHDQKNFKPKFDVESWATREQVGAYINGELTLDQLLEGDEAPKKKGRRK